MQRYERALNTKDINYSLFMAHLREAIFIYCADDIENVMYKFRNQGLTDEQIERLSTSQFVKNGKVRRFIPPKDILAERVQKVVDFHLVFNFTLL